MAKLPASDPLCLVVSRLRRELAQASRAYHAAHPQQVAQQHQELTSAAHLHQQVGRLLDKLCVKRATEYAIPQPGQRTASPRADILP